MNREELEEFKKWFHSFYESMQGKSDYEIINVPKRRLMQIHYWIMERDQEIRFRKNETKEWCKRLYEIAGEME